MIEIDKTNKPDAFQELYRRANPLPDVAPKVPLLHVESLGDDFVLCESCVITEYLSTMGTRSAEINKRQSQYWPACPKERSKLRLFMELCGSSFSSYLDFTRVQDRQQVQTQYTLLQQKMREVDAFLSFLSNTNFTMADAHVAPFIQRCCVILPPPYDPVSISEHLGMKHLHPWIQSILARDSVITTAPSVEEMESKRSKLIKRLGRIKN
jgi:glutathione S-transferase